jgi:hypothetical protein
MRRTPGEAGKGFERIEGRPAAAGRCGCGALVAAGAAVPTRGFAAPSVGCLGERATITGSGIIDGAEGDDVIVRSSVNDTIDGGGGDDLVCGLGGNDARAGGALGARRSGCSVSLLAP